MNPTKPESVVVQATPSDENAAPIIVDMGKKDRKQIRKLTKGKPGRLMRRLEETLDHLRENGALADGVQPVVIVIRQKPRKRGKRFAKVWGLG